MKDRLIQMTRSRPAKILWWLVLTIAMVVFTGMAYISYAGLDANVYDAQAKSYWETPNANNSLYNMTYDVLDAWSVQKWKGSENPATYGFYNAQETEAMPYELYYVDEYGIKQQEIYTPSHEKANQNQLLARTYFMMYPDHEGYEILGRVCYQNNEIVSVESMNGWNALTWNRDDGTIQLHPEVVVEAAQTGTVSVWVQQQDVTGAASEVFDKGQAALAAQEEVPQWKKDGNFRLGAFDQYVNEEAFLNGKIQSDPWYLDAMQRAQVLHQILYALRGKAFVIQSICILIGVFAVVMIGFGAGWKLGKERPQLCWYDQIPMEVQLIAFLGLAFGGIFLVCELNGTLLWRWNSINVQWLMPGIDTYPELFAAMIPMIVGTFLLMELFAWAIIFSFVRWAKQGNLFGGFWTFRVLKTVFSAVPLILQCTLLMAAAGVIQFFLTINSWWDGPFWTLLFGGFVWLVTFICIAYAALSLQDLRRLAKAFLAGDYNAKPKFKYYYPIMQEIGEDICRVGDGMNVAVEQRIKSERMKTELITNVSHDLKTPLTSIINYTDLLQHEELPPQAAEYAEIIARQGERLHKLTVDLVDASKAASGVMSCTKAPTDVKELCEQAMGEYTERLTAVGLIPVLSMPEEDLVAQLDGRLTWRILDNLLSNACKYAQPGTRVYLVVSQQDGKVSLTLKNISRDPLNVPAEELMERFVRGDSARSSEGSGLGLSIARSLAELQGGSFNLYINGDLFQAQATFPLEQAQ